MKHNKTLVALLGAASLTVCLTAAEPTAQTAKPASAAPDAVVAKGTGFEIKRSQVDESLDAIKAQATAARQAPPTDAQVLDNLINKRLLLAHVTEADKTNAEAKVEKALAEERKRAGSEELFNSLLKSRGKNLEQVRTEWKEQATLNEVINREVVSKVPATEADIQKFYTENMEKMTQPERVRAAHVLISIKDPTDKAPPAQQKDLPADKKAEKRKVAEDVLKRAKAGEDFAKLAKELSDDPGSKEKGGEYTFGRGQMVPEFEAAAFGQDVGQISDIVTTTYGYHIIKTLEKFPKRTTPLAEISDKIRQFLQQREAQKQVPPYLESLKKEANVEILDASLKLQPQPLAMPPAAAPAAPATPAAPKAK